MATKATKAADAAAPADEQATAPADTSAEETASKPAKTPKKRSSAEETASYEETVADMKAFLDKQPVVKIFIPLQNGEPKGTLYPVEINGYKVKIPKNIYVEVPQSIAEIVMHSLNIYEEASSSLTSDVNGQPLRLDLQTGEAKAALNA